MIDLMRELGFRDEDMPAIRAAQLEYSARLDAAEVRYCANGCVNHYDPGADKPLTGMGIAGCTEPECN